jgi:acyl dehydratase
LGLNRSLVGKEYPPVTMTVARERVTAFTRSIGETSVVFLDAEAARAAGYAEQLAPPTFVTALQFEGIRQLVEDPDLGLDFTRVLHGDQEFEWHRPIVVGDQLTAVARISAIRGRGSMESLVVETDVRDAMGETVVISRGTLIHRGVEDGGG